MATKVIQITLSEEEYDLIIRRANEVGVSPSMYIKNEVLCSRLRNSF